MSLAKQNVAMVVRAMALKPKNNFRWKVVGIVLFGTKSLFFLILPGEKIIEYD